MKFLLKKSAASGQILVTALVMAAVLGVALGAYLMLLTSNNNLTVRSQIWNMTLHVAEAGVEEAFGFLNDVTVTNVAARNGWSWNGSSNAFYKLREIGDGYFEAYIVTNGPAPVITSYGYMPSPAPPYPCPA
jgi:hypothetical protein